MVAARRGSPLFRQISSDGGVMVATVGETLAAWGAYDQDDPFPLFARVRELGAVHSVTLADGHGAWLVCGHEQARAALKDRRLSKDMHAAMAARWRRSRRRARRGAPPTATIRSRCSPRCVSWARCMR